MRYKQPDSSVPVLIQQVVRPLGMYDDTLDPLGVYFFETSLQIGIVIRILRDRLVDIYYIFLCERNDIQKRQVDEITVRQINETGSPISQDEVQQGQVIPEQTRYFTEFISPVLMQKKRFTVILTGIIRQNGNIRARDCR